MSFFIPDSLRVSDTAVILLSTTFFVYRIFKAYEPHQPTHLFALLLVVPTFVVPCVWVHVSFLPLAALTTYASYWFLILFYTACYRLGPFHPLARYPGPLLCKLSQLWMTYIASTGRKHLYLKELHEQYGDAVRIGPNAVSVSNAEGIQTVLGPQGMIKGPWWSNRVAPGTTIALIAEPDPVLHKQRRKPWDKAFNTASLKDYEEIVANRSKELCDALEQRSGAGEVVDLDRWISYFAFDFMGDMAFGSGFDLLSTGSDPHGIWHILEEGVKSASVVGQTPWAYSLARLVPSIQARRAKLVSSVRAMLEKRVESGSQRRDLYHHLSDGGEAPIPRVLNDAVLAVVAGSDTTAGTMAALCYFLLLNKQDTAPGEICIWDRLRDEVDDAFPDGEEPRDYTKMAGMPYLNAVINEALRMLPPVMSGIQRTPPRGSGGTMVGPHYIAEGNQVSIHTISIQRSPLYFSPLPNTFWPDRWLPAASRKYPHTLAKDTEFILDQSAFSPFSIGPANCAGKSLALLELRGLTCYMMQRFESFEVAEGFKLESWEEGLQDHFTTLRPPMPVRITMRKV